MRERFFGLLKEYLAGLHDCDVFHQQVLAAPEGIERELPYLLHGPTSRSLDVRVSANIELCRERDLGQEL